MQQSVVIGTRGSKLALAQATIVKTAIAQRYPDTAIEIKIISTAGDRDQHTTLSTMGGKGMFIRDLEQALLDGEIDIAVHSFKDITTRLPPSLELCAFLRPESVCDVLVSGGNLLLSQLPPGARIGTGSMRRRALLSRLRPDIVFADIRGNIDTRLAKLGQKLYDAIVLSEAGLIRLGLQGVIAQRFDPQSFFPAPGQGVIALEIRRDNASIRALCVGTGDSLQRVCSRAELSLLEYLGFDCRTPLGVYTCLENGLLCMSGFYVHPESDTFVERKIQGFQIEPEELGRRFSALLLDKGARV